MIKNEGKQVLLFDICLSSWKKISDNEEPVNKCVICSSSVIEIRELNNCFAV